MSPGLVLLLSLGLSAGDPLASAREAFARQDYAAAAALALDVAAPPAEGAALELAGLARFRRGEPEAALALLDRAGRAADAPARGRWDFNRAACLYELGRFEEAEAAFLEAARREPAVEAAALANAGFAALDAGAAARARELAGRARRVASGSAMGLVEELERAVEGAASTSTPTATATSTPTPTSTSTPTSTPTATSTPTSTSTSALLEHDAGLAAWDRGDAAAARAHFDRAVALDPSSTRSAIMAAAAAARLGARTAARDALARVLAGPLDEADRRLALDHLDAASPGLAARGTGWEGSVRLGGGADGNVLQSGAVAGDRASTASSPVSSGLLSAGGGLAWRARLAPSLRLELAWGFDQLAYLSSAAEDASLQQHLVGAALEWTRGRLRLGASGAGQLALAGRANLRLEQGGGGAGAWAAWDWGDDASTRLDLGWDRRRAPRAEFAYLAGDRLEGSLSHAQQVGPALLTLSGRLRAERLGTLRQATTLALPPELCGFQGCASEAQVIPFGYRSAGLALSAQAPLAPRLTLTLSGGWERRRYDADNFLEVVPVAGATLALDRRRRLDDRAFGAAAASLRIAPWLSLGLRWDLLRSWSNVARAGHMGTGPGGGCNPFDPACHALDFDDKNYLKQVVGVEAVAGF